MHVPPRLGPSKNLYQFTQLRDSYKQKFIEASQMMTNVGALPINFEIEAASLAEAVERYGDDDFAAGGSDRLHGYSGA